MKFKLGNGEIQTGWEAFKSWTYVFLFILFVIGICAGIFFLKSFRWGF